ncbi:MAG: biotin--[acetyl-CoA-carboxylase] ligase [Rhodospirillales bacterium]
MTAARHGAGDFSVHAYGELDSTNEEMKRLAAAGKAGHGSVVRADVQTAGRGRRGRVWVSKPGNLYCSFLLLPRRSLNQSAQLSFVMAVAVADALEKITGGDRAVTGKWPNDVLLRGRKIAGILLETVSVNPEGEESEGIVAGLGVNIAHYPEDTAYPATSLEACGIEGQTPETVLRGVCAAFAPLYGSWLGDGFEPVRAAWLERAAGLGETIRVRFGEEDLSGVFEGLDGSGALLLLEDDGNRRQITAGDVYFADTALQRAS